MAESAAVYPKRTCLGLGLLLTTTLSQCVPDVRLRDEASGGADGGPAGSDGGGRGGGNGGASGAASGGTPASAGERSDGGNVGVGGADDGCSGSQVFEYTGSAQTFQVPSCAQAVVIEAYGAEGGTAFNLAGAQPVGGRGARVVARLQVTPDEILNVYVGGRGEDGLEARAGRGGWNGGGNGGYTRGADWVAAAAGGGGASDVRKEGTALTRRQVVAAGGGGAAGNCSSGVRPAGGHGGGDIGAPGGMCYATSGSEGGGGTQLEGGLGGNYFDCTSDPGDLGEGGSSCSAAGGGGGGGYYGGGAGAWGGGGGGSNFIGDQALLVSQERGEHSGDGRVIISW